VTEVTGAVSLTKAIGR